MGNPVSPMTCRQLRYAKRWRIENSIEEAVSVCYAPSMRKITIVCMMFGLPVVAWTHNLHQSTGEITVRNKTVNWDIIAHDQDVKRLSKDLKPLLSHRIVVENNGTVCPLSNATMAPSKEEANHTKIAMQFECAAPVSKLTLYYNLFFGQRDHVHSATVHMGDTTHLFSFTGMKTSASLTP